MTLADDNKHCGPCRLRGLLRKAHRIVIVGKQKVMMCDEDFRLEMGWPQLNREKQALVDIWAACSKAQITFKTRVPLPRRARVPHSP